jgi:hypothetical protein
MKHEWKKHEKKYYLPGTRPELIRVPPFNFFSIRGRGNPNDEFFADYIGVLYSLSYAVRMSPKQGLAPEGYFEYTVYPLEGIWDIDEDAKKEYSGTLDKDSLVFNLMIRQPDFVDEAYAAETIERTKQIKPHPLLEQVNFETIEDGDCIQVLHIGPYDDETASFRRMEEFADEQQVQRKESIHREIYLSDVRKLAPEKLKTVLRFQVHSS